MAETDKIIELGREPGFCRSVFNAVYPASSQMLHKDIICTFVNRLIEIKNSAGTFSIGSL